jgi:cytochrome c2
MMRLFLVMLASAVLLTNLGCSNGAAAADGSHAASRRGTQELMIQYGCPTCHVVHGVPGAVGKVGPSLDGLAQRSYLGGVLPNNPENLQLWLMHPQRYHPGTAMPEMGVSAQDARQMTEFLETLH